MLPIKLGKRRTDPHFKGSEKLFRRVPLDHLNNLGEVEPSKIQVSFKSDVASSPSVLRSKYATVLDLLHSLCGCDMEIPCRAFFLRVSDLPKEVPAGTGDLFDFKAFHEPLDLCYAHTVVGCCKSGDQTAQHVKPSRAVRNDFRTKFALALKPAPKSTKLQNLILKSWRGLQFLFGSKA
ncbi:MAG: hypothetical protein WA700_05840 [Acidobacteriaceae bacterium]